VDLRMPSKGDPGGAHCGILAVSGDDRDLGAASPALRRCSQSHRARIVRRVTAERWIARGSAPPGATIGFGMYPNDIS
jgi:hypothetical protein